MVSPPPDGPGRAELAAAATWELLSAGGDSRHRLDDTGYNRYRNRYEPEPGLIAFGSCTSSTVSDEAYAQARRLHGWLLALEDRYLDLAIDDLYQRVRTELVANLAMSAAQTFDVVITPSGTDAEFIPLLLALERGREVTSIVVGAVEAGSGTSAAAAGLHFDPVTPTGRTVEPGTPVDAEVASRVEVRHVDIRDAACSLRPIGEIDAEVAEIVAESRSRGRSLLVHLIAHSKTGVHAPSPALLHDLLGADDVDIVVDAAQGRFSRRGLGAALRDGYMAMVTGSKFFGGPPFCGAVLVPRREGRRVAVDRFPEGFADYFSPAMLPRDWRSARASLTAWRSFGLLLRWWASLQEIRDYYSVPARLRFDVLAHFQRIVPAVAGDVSSVLLDVVPNDLDDEASHRLLESKTTVFPFRCFDPSGRQLDKAELTSLRHQLRHPSDGRPIEIGQPVTLGAGPSQSDVLRVALGGRDVIRACVLSDAGGTFEARLDRLTDDVRATFGALDAIVRGGRA